MNRLNLGGIDVTLTSAPRPRTPDSELGFGRVFTDHMLLWEYEAKSGWHTPRIVPYGPLTLDPAAMVFHYGQAMFEGMKGFRGQDGKVRLFRPADHCRRMAFGANRLCMAPVDSEMLLKAVLTLAQVDQDWVPASPGTAVYIRPTLIATEPALGVRAAERFLLFVILSPVTAYYSAGWKPLRIWIEQKYVRAAPGGIGHVKAGANYVASLLASEEAKKKGYAQVLWLDAKERRLIEEVGTMNLFVRIGDEVITPPLEGSILGGITRDSVIALLKSWRMKVSERRISMDELLAAHRAGTLAEVFGTGTASVIAPVSELGYGEQTLVINGGQVGELSQKLYDTVTGVQYGQKPDTFGWMAEVPQFVRPEASRVRAG